jgi:hypothetical protein
LTLVKAPALPICKVCGEEIANRTLYMSEDGNTREPLDRHESCPTFKGREWHVPVGQRPGILSLVTLRPKKPTPIKGPIPAMVPCERYRAQLTVKSCAARWKIGNNGDGYLTPLERARFAMKDRHSLCTGCPTGQARSEAIAPKPTLLPPPLPESENK